MVLDAKEFLTFFDNDQRLVKEHEFRQSIFKKGIQAELRNEIWKYLFHFYSFNSTHRERMIKDKEMLMEYFLMKTKWSLIQEAINASQNPNVDSVPGPSIPFNIEIDLSKDKYKIHQSCPAIPMNNNDAQEEQQINLDSIKIQTILKVSRKSISHKKLMEDIAQIEKDIERTSYLTDLDKVDSLSSEAKTKIKNALRNVLITFAAFNQSVEEPKSSQSKEMSQRQFNLGYTQGMNEFASLFVDVFSDESTAYWCFSNFMLFDMHSTSAIALNTISIDDSHMLKTNVAHYFSDLGVKKKLCYLSHLLNMTDPQLFEHLKKLELDNLCFCHEWLILLFKRCFANNSTYLRCFEMLNSHFIELHTSALKSISMKEIYSFDMFICLALIEHMREKILCECESDMDVYTIVRDINKSCRLDSNYDELIALASQMFEKYCIKNSSLPDFSQLSNLNDSSSVKKQLKRFKEFMFSLEF